MAWFGPNKDEAWRQLSREIGAEFIEGGLWSGSKVQAQAGAWTITLDLYTVSRGKDSSSYTRMRAPFVNRGGFHFEVYRKGIFSALGKRLGMQDIEIGHPAFDEAFIIKGADEGKVRELFANPRLRALIGSQPAIHLQVKDDEGWFGARFPDGVDELYFIADGTIRNIDRLKALYELFAECLDQLCRIDAGSKEDPGVTL
jgi:hypothetical protein